MTPSAAAGYVAGLFFLQDQVRFGAPAKSNVAGASDRRSSLYNSYAILAALLVCFVLPKWLPHGFARLPSGNLVGWSGVGLGLLGIFTRLWAVLTLREQYTRTLQVQPGWSVVRRGPYRWVRHPGYLGSIMTWTGVALATASALVIALTVAAILWAYGYRIRSEEAMLLDAYGDDYRAYQRRTRRLIPALW